MADLFGHSIRWSDEKPLEGIASDGRRIEITISILTHRFVAVIPIHGRDVVTRRAERSLEDARAAAELAVKDTQT